MSLVRPRSRPRSRSAARPAVHGHRRLRSVGVAAGVALLAAAMTLPTVTSLPAAGQVPSQVAAQPSAVAAAAATAWRTGACTAAQTTGVTVVVDVQNLNNPLTPPVVRCVTGLTAASTGLAALQAAGVTPVGTQQYGLQFVCRISGRPSPTESFTVSGKAYTEGCVRTPPAAAYWGYWQATSGGAWTYSTQGASARTVKLGGFEGWSFSLNRTASTNPKPRVTPSRVAAGKAAAVVAADGIATTTGSTLDTIPTDTTPTDTAPSGADPSSVDPTTSYPTSSDPTTRGPGSSGPSTSDSSTTDPAIAPAATAATSATSSSRGTAAPAAPSSVGSSPSSSVGSSPSASSAGSSTRATAPAPSSSTAASSAGSPSTAAPRSTATPRTSVTARRPAELRAAPAATDERARQTARWLGEQLAAQPSGLFTNAFSGALDYGLTMDAVLALAAAGVGGDLIDATVGIIESSGEAYVGAPAAAADNAAKIAKTALTLEVAGGDPTLFPAGPGSRDLIAELRGTADVHGRFGNDASFPSAFSQSLAVLALDRSADGVPASALTWLQSQQCTDTASSNVGGYSYSGSCDEGDVDPDVTALSVQALLAADVDPADPSVADAVSYLERIQAADGSVGGPFSGQNTNSTGLAVQALTAAGTTGTAATDGAAFVASLQVTCDDLGTRFFAADLGAVAAVADDFAAPIADHTDGWIRASSQALYAFGLPAFGAIAAAGTERTLPAAPLCSTPAADPRALQAARWIGTQLAATSNGLLGGDFPDYGLSMDAVFALAAAGVGGQQIARTAEAVRASGYDTDTSFLYAGASAGAIAKVVLTLQVAGLDPTTFPTGTGGTVDLVAMLRDAYDAAGDGSFGVGDFPFTHAIGIWALDRTADGVPAAAVSWLQGRQCTDVDSPNLGAYSYDTDDLCASDGIDADGTAFAIQALAAADVANDDPSIGRAVAYITRIQQSSGGVPSSFGGVNTNNSGLAAQSLRRVGLETASADRMTTFVAGLQVDCRAVTAGSRFTVADLGGIAYDADGFATPVNDSRDQWIRASTQAIFAFGAPSFDRITAAGAAPALPSAADCGTPPVTTTPVTTTPGTPTSDTSSPDTSSADTSAPDTSATDTSAPGTSTGPSTAPSGSTASSTATTSGIGGPALTLDATTVAAGGVVTAAVVRGGADVDYLATLYPAPVLLGTLSTDADGTGTAALTIPADTAVGRHRIELVAGATVLAAELVVTAAEGVGVTSGTDAVGGDNPGNGGGLAETGVTSATTTLLGIGGLMLLGGALLLLITRRRTPAGVAGAHRP